MIKHMMEKHEDKLEESEPQWRMRVMRAFRKPLQRQVAEAVTIEKSKIEYRLNSKGEWMGARIPESKLKWGTE